jgi:hypothetical protein
MVLPPHGTRVDYDLDLLEHIMRILDAQLDRDCDTANASSDPDGFGLFDRMEHLTGLGFVACQTYLVSAYGSIGIPKDIALQCGPLHCPSLSVAGLVNHAANLWKHQDEWALQQNTRARDRIIKAFDDLGLPALGEYPLSGCLAEICYQTEARFRSVLPFLIQWRDALRSH